MGFGYRDLQFGGLIGLLPAQRLPQVDQGYPLDLRGCDSQRQTGPLVRLLVALDANRRPGEDHVALDGGFVRLVVLRTLLGKQRDVLIDPLVGHLGDRLVHLDPLQLGQVELGGDLHLEAELQVAAVGQLDILQVQVGLADGLQLAGLDGVSDRLPDQRVANVLGDLLPEPLLEQPSRRPPDPESRHLRRARKLPEHLVALGVDPLTPDRHRHLLLQRRDFLDVDLVGGKVVFLLGLLVLGGLGLGFGVLGIFGHDGHRSLRIDHDQAHRRSGPPAIARRLPRRRW